jgi:hypothetical protein
LKLVIGAFPTLSEAESATRALMDAGHDQDAIEAYGRIGGGKLLLAGRVPVRPVGEPARLVSRAERARTWAAVGAVAGLVVATAALVISRLTGFDLLAGMPPVLAGWPGTALVLLMAAVVVGGLAALARRTDGLPHDLAFRYGVRLDQGDTVVAVRTFSGDETRAAQELLGIHGAVYAHATRGTVEPLGALPPGVTLQPSQN